MAGFGVTTLGRIWVTTEVTINKLLNEWGKWGKELHDGDMTAAILDRV